MGIYQKAQALKILSCYITPNVEDYLEKGHPVGYINKYGKQKQADGSWKYVGKNKPQDSQPVQGIKLGIVTSGQPAGTIGAKEEGGAPYIKIADNHWILFETFLASWNHNFPDNLKSKLNIPEYSNLSPATQEAIEKFLVLDGGTPDKERPREIKPNQFDDKFGENIAEAARYVTDNILSFTSEDFNDLLEAKLAPHILSNSLEGDIEATTGSLRASVSDYIASIAFATDREELKPGKLAHADFSECTRGQMVMINAYTKDAFKAINFYLSGSFRNRNIEIPPKIQKLIELGVETLNKGIKNIKNNPTEEYKTVYRTYSPRTTTGESDYHRKLKSKAVDYMMHINDTIKPGTIMSTTFGDLAFGGNDRMVYKIDNSAGVGKCIKDISAFSQENEILFPTTAEFRVHDVRVTSKSIVSEKYNNLSGMYFVELESI